MEEKDKNKRSLISAKNLVKTFNKINVLKGLNIDFNEGDRIALIGQNGAGKTTLIRCILGQYIFDGELKVMGYNPRLDHETLMQHIGFIPQTPPPIKMTVGEMIDFFSKLSKTNEEEFVKIGEDMGLDVQSNLNKPFLKLSGGMKQKLLVALALGRKPEILLMDEPSANLDPAARKVFFKYLEEYDKKALMIISSHRVKELENLATRVVEMDLGEVLIDKKIDINI